MTKKSIPNMITGVRLIGAIVLIFCVPLSVPFLIIYSVCGFTDCIDGAIARKLDAVSEAGSKLDTAADLIFYSVMMCKMLPIMWVQFNKSIFVVLGIIIIIRILMYAVVFLRFYKLDSPHTLLNKLTGVCVFLIPYASFLSIFEIFCWCTCIIALAAIVFQMRGAKRKEGKVEQAGE